MLVVDVKVNPLFSHTADYTLCLREILSLHIYLIAVFYNDKQQDSFKRHLFITNAV